MNWRDVSSWANGLGCDLCGLVPSHEAAQPVVGWVRVTQLDRGTHSIAASAVFAVCADHITCGEPVYPEQAS